MTASEHQTLQVRWAQDYQALESRQEQLAALRVVLAKERERREAAETEVLRLQAHQQAIDQLMTQLRNDITSRVSDREKATS